MKYEIKTPAKINTFLKITGKDPVSGMHFLESVMIPVDLFDIISIEESSCTDIITKGVCENIPSEKNIVFKALKALETFAGIELPSFKVIIEKSIPTGAGLGGGSSNAAGIILFLNDHLKLDLTKENLVEIGYAVGSDVPFFLCRSSALVRGKGEIVEPLKVKSSGKHLLLLYPEIIINTGFAYSLIDKKKLTKSCSVNINIVRQNGTCSLEDWTKLIFNDFEEPVFNEWPLLKELKGSLESSGAEKVFMSGSGSTLIAVFASDKTRDKALDEYSRRFVTVRKIELLTG